MEALTRLVADSLARHGLDRPVDPRRLQWSRWSRCDSLHSLLVVPSKPGIFALAEEIMNLGATTAHAAADAIVHQPLGNAHVGTAAPGYSAEQSSAAVFTKSTSGETTNREGHDFSLVVSATPSTAALAAQVPQRRMLAVLQFSEDDDMAFTLDRMFTCINPMRTRLTTGRCFVRYVVIADQGQRRTICAALNQWLVSSAEKATGFPADFSSTLEVATARVGAGDPPAQTGTAAQALPVATPNLDSGAAKNLHCPHSFPSGF